MLKENSVILTGGVASGKTAVSDAFARLGVPIVDTDLIAREVVEPGRPALAELARLAGDEIIDASGQLDRRQLRLKIIAEPELRRAVEAVLHPRIEQRSLELIEQAQGPYCLVAVPLFVESGRFRWASRVLVVDVAESVQLERLMARDQMSLSQAQGLLAAQASRQQRLDVATEVIENQGSLADLELAVTRLHQHYLHFFQPPHQPDN